MNLLGIDIDANHLPQHVAIIMDGNGRWAKKRGLDRVKGHEKGYLVLKEIIDFNKNVGVPYISVFAFSTENWTRPAEEVQFLMHLARTIVEEYTETLLKNDVRLFITGTDENLGQELIAMLRESVRKTSHCKAYTLNIAFNYGGKRELIDGMKKAAVDYKTGLLKLEDLNEASFEKYLYHPDVPEVDLLIRTSGEQRISNFFLWQCAYSEFWFTKKFWPDFKPKDYCRAVSDYQKRKRRFGSVS